MAGNAAFFQDAYSNSINANLAAGQPQLKAYYNPYNGRLGYTYNDDLSFIHDPSTSNTTPSTTTQPTTPTPGTTPTAASSDSSTLGITPNPSTNTDTNSSGTSGSNSNPSNTNGSAPFGVTGSQIGNGVVTAASTAFGVPGLSQAVGGVAGLMSSNQTQAAMQAAGIPGDINPVTATLASIAPFGIMSNQSLSNQVNNAITTNTDKGIAAGIVNSQDRGEEMTAAHSNLNAAIANTPSFDPYGKGGVGDIGTAAPATAPTSTVSSIGLNGQPIGQSGAMGTTGESAQGDLGDPGTNQGMDVSSSAPQGSDAATTTSTNDVTADAGGGDGGGDGGGSGTVICTELYNRGYMDKDTYIADQAYGKKLDPSILVGYHFWAKTVVKWMQNSEIITKIVAKIASPWALEMAFLMGYKPKGSIIGKLLIAIFYPICKFIGKVKS